MTPVSEQGFGRRPSGAAGLDGGRPGGQLGSTNSASMIGLGGAACLFGLRAGLYDNDGTTLSTQSPNHGKVISYRPGFRSNKTPQRPLPFETEAETVRILQDRLFLDAGYIRNGFGELRDVISRGPRKVVIHPDEGLGTSVECQQFRVDDIAIRFGHEYNPGIPWRLGGRPVGQIQADARTAKEIDGCSGFLSRSNLQGGARAWNSGGECASIAIPFRLYEI
jgi:hypothetical protein